MALPSLNATPSYEVKVPSSGELLKYRPFLVKEQKILMLAYESRDKKQIIGAMLDTIKSCVEGVDVSKLATFDVDYIFTQLRAKSVGEKIGIKLPCDECKADNDIEINVEELSINLEKGEKVVKLTPEISIKLKYPTYQDFMNKVNLNTESQTETIMDIIIACMDSVATEEENINLKNETKEEVVKFIESMNSKQFELVSEFVQEMPQLEYKTNIQCVKCGHEQEKVLRGLDDFF